MRMTRNHADNRCSALLLLLLGILLTGSNTVLQTQAKNLDNRQERPDILDYGDGIRYDYCDALHPVLTKYLNPRVEGSVLTNVQLFIRHGDRTPVQVRPQDKDMTWECDAHPGYFTFADTQTSQPNNSVTTAAALANQVVTVPHDSPYADYLWKGNCNVGQLTPKGADQQRRMGQDLRQIYVDRLKFLPTIFDPTTMRLRSTDVWRTKQSAENLMIGLYGEEAQAQGQPQLVFQIHTLPKEIDYMTMNKERCPRINEIIDATRKESEVLRQISRTHATFQKQVNQIVLGEEQDQNGENQKDDLVIVDLIDTILPRICHDMPLQCMGDDKHGQLKCLTKEMADECLIIEAKENAEVWRDAKGAQEMLQLGIGPLTRDIQRNFLEAAAPFLLYSGHDTTLLPLLGMLNSADMRWPPYASNLIFELWSSPSMERFVRVLYNGRVVKTKSNWCDLEWCPLDTVVNYLGQFIVDNLGARCKRHEQGS